MKRIACLTTWWTIFSVWSEKWLVPWTNTEKFIDRLNNILWKELEVDFINLYSIDSSDVKIENFIQIASKIYELKDKYDWFVIFHWTDTMAYTASVLSYMIKWFRKPIILTWSMISLEFEWTDAISNILNSFRASINKELFWVYIVFWDKLILWNKAFKLHTTSLNTFVSVNFPLVGKFENWKLILNTEVLDKINRTILAEFKDLNIDLDLEDKVYLLKLFPGINYKIFDWLIGLWIKWLVIEWFWDWNVPSDENFRNYIKKCLDSWMNIILKSQCIFWKVKSNYAWWKALLDMWCISWDVLTCLLYTSPSPRD
jgi:L-asparaginase